MTDVYFLALWSKIFTYASWSSPVGQLFLGIGYQENLWIRSPHAILICSCFPISASFHHCVLSKQDIPTTLDRMDLQEILFCEQTDYVHLKLTSTRFHTFSFISKWKRSDLSISVLELTRFSQAIGLHDLHRKLIELPGAFFHPCDNLIFHFALTTISKL